MLITENEIDEWMRGHAQEAQGVVAELVARLTSAAVPNPSERRFPMADSIGQHGSDGYLETNVPFMHLVPEGQSEWEFGAGVNARDKATGDYTAKTGAVPEAKRLQRTFVFVTPMSGRRDWPNTWKPDGIETWIEERKALGQWKDVRVIDGTKLADWIEQFPSVGDWLASRMGRTLGGIQGPERYWAKLRSMGDPPPLVPDVFLENRAKAQDKLKSLLAGESRTLKLETRYSRSSAADFVSSYVASLDEAQRLEAAGRCLIVSKADSWEGLVALQRPHVLVVDFQVDDSEGQASRLFKSATLNRHQVVYADGPGGFPSANNVALPDPKVFELQKALEKSGYTRERARSVSQRCDGNLQALVRCIANLSEMPEWARNDDASNLAIMQLLGQWDENVEGDRAAIEDFGGKEYGEWIREAQKIHGRPDTPLNHHDGKWEIASRYEVWHLLGSRVFEEHLERFRAVAIKVLKEKHPKFELPSKDRYAAAIYGKVSVHSDRFRVGLAQTLAMLGNHSKALSSIRPGRGEVIAVLAVREILEGADWVLWASLDRLLPLLAEAAPNEFLRQVELALGREDKPFSKVFELEGDGITGGNYMSGLVWALETLAWSSDYLIQTLVLLGELAAIDPGGKWANRADSSITDILLPWLPQTCAPVEKRLGAMSTLLKEQPEVGWKALKSLLPGERQHSSGTHRPEWMETIPADLPENVSGKDHWQQINGYSVMAVQAAVNDPQKLSNLVKRIDHLTGPAFNSLLDKLASEPVISWSEDERYPVWKSLLETASRHRTYADAEWAMPADLLEKLDKILGDLAPKRADIRYRRLFTEQLHDLIGDIKNFEEEAKNLELKKRDAVKDIFEQGGLDAVLKFSEDTKAAVRVAAALGSIEAIPLDSAILPMMFGQEGQSKQFAEGYAWGRFAACGWAWVDSLGIEKWSDAEKVSMFIVLPFEKPTWDRVEKILGKDEGMYWKVVPANAFQIRSDHDTAIEKAITNSRGILAVECISKKNHDKLPFNAGQAVRALKSLLESVETPNSFTRHAVEELIKKLQADDTVPVEDMLMIEWGFLPLLNKYNHGSPKKLEEHIAANPAFFCELIATIYRPRNQAEDEGKVSEQKKRLADNAYTLLGEWGVVPGTGPDGTIEEAKLVAWIDAVKKSCAESGHLEVALVHVGHALIHAPADPNGLWIHEAVARVLDAKDSQDIRDGYRTELYNSRGAVIYDGGKGEAALAKRYADKAEKVEAKGFFRLARTLKSLSEGYKEESERQASRDIFED